jgi:hypothetical protein
MENYMRYIFDTPKLVNNFTDEEQLDLTTEDIDALDKAFDQHIDAEEYAYFWRTADGQQELRF